MMRRYNVTESPEKFGLGHRLEETVKMLSALYFKISPQKILMACADYVC